MPPRFIDHQAWLALFLCKDCGVNTHEINEYYMVKHDIWRSINSEGSGRFKGMLCIGCLEKRLGRLLTSADFLDAPINRDKRQSARLYSRINSCMLDR